MSNDPYKSTRPAWAYSDKDSGRSKVERDPRVDDRPRCRVCDIPMQRAWFYVSVDGPWADRTENKFDSDDFCSVRCLKRRLYGLPNDEDKALDVLLRRVEVAEAEAKEATALSHAHEAHLEQIRRALAHVLEISPGLAKGAVAPPGQLLAERVGTLQKLVEQRVLVDLHDSPRRRRLG
jgi:hypothetical protein